MDAQLNELIRLKQPLAAPVERWQMVPTRQRPPRTLNSQEILPACANSPLRVRTPSAANIVVPTTPESSKYVVKYKKTPKIRTPTKTPGQTAGKATKTPGKSCSKTPHAHSKKRTPPRSGKKKTPGKTGHTPSGCRFIPNRSTTDLEISSYLLQNSKKEPSDDSEDSPSKEEYRQALMKVLSKSKNQSRVLSFTSATPSMEGSLLNYTADMSASHNGSFLRSSQKKRSQHHMPTSADRILDAPGLLDDYYLNTLDWGKNRQLAIGLGNTVFLWNATDGSVQQLMELGSETDYVSSVSWAGNGKYLAVGSSDAAIQLWDVVKEKRVRVMQGHTDRVGVLTWNSHNLTSGCRDGSIHYHDVRKPQHCVNQSHCHQLEVCGLRWSADGRHLASGANDNLCCIWNASNPQEPLHILRGHVAAVKAVSWCPWQHHVVATGGGTSDRCIKFWNASSGQCLDSVDTKSQVSAISWNREHRELISAHGNPRHQMVVWKYPSMARVGELVGHQGRVLHMSLSPRRTTVASAGADETLRMWKCFEPCKSHDQSRSNTEDSITALLHSVR